MYVMKKSIGIIVLLYLMIFPVIINATEKYSGSVQRDKCNREI